MCNDDVTGLFSALYDAWKYCRHNCEVEIAFHGCMEAKLFCDYVESEASEEKALAVERLIQNHLGGISYRMLYHAALSHDKNKGNAIWGTMIAARNMKDSTKVMDNLTNPSVEKVFELYRQVSNEAHFFKEILRFRELESGILFAQIEPKSQILTLIAPHFENRLPLENWMIYDKTHKAFVVHEAKRQWVHVLGAQISEKKLERVSDQELEIQQLWKGFFRSISIKERESHERQRLHFPIWYRKNAVEFQES